MAFIFMVRVSREAIREFALCPTSLGTARKAECAGGRGREGADDAAVVAARPPGEAARQPHGARPHPRRGARILRRRRLCRGRYPGVAGEPRARTASAGLRDRAARPARRRRTAALSPYLARIRDEKADGRRHGADLAAG